MARCSVFGLATLTAFGAGASAQETTPASPGAMLSSLAEAGVFVGPDEQPNGDYGGLYTWPEMVTEMDGWLRDYPQLTRVQSLGKTVEGRSIPIFKISDNPAIDEDEPEVLFLVGVHPREQPPTIAIMNFVKELLSGYGKDAEITELLNTRELWVVPMLNIDGKVYDFQNGDGKISGPSWRKNRRANPDGTFGVDLNRNFPSRWGGSREYDKSWKTDALNTDGFIYEGPAPASEPETRAIMEFIESRPLRIMLDIHAPLHDIRAPQMLSAREQPIFKRLLEAMRDSQKQPYKIRIEDPDPDAAPTDADRFGGNGVSFPWSYYATGAYSFNLEIGSEKGPKRHYVTPEFGVQEYRDNVRGPLLTLLREAGNLKPVSKGSNSFGPSQWEGTPKAGERVVWKPQIGGEFDYAFVSSASAAGVVKLEYRLAPATEGFPIEIQPNAREGGRIPLKLHVWDKERGLSVLEEELIVK